MARDRGRDNPARAKRQRKLRREVYVFTEGAVTEPGFITFVTENGTRKEPGREIVCKVENRAAPTKRRKPLPLVEDASTKWREVRRAAEKAGLEPDHWNWPQVWCLFDRDQHKDIPTAFADARREGLHVAYSHPCFELWRLLHYQNYTSDFGGVCDSAANRLKQQPGFAQTYGPTIRSVSEEQAKHVMPGQLSGRYKTARRYAEGFASRHAGRTDQNSWDPYTDVWRFVEDGMDVSDY
ncbi:MAG: RloB domain-containing protein [Streptomyces sp.]|jgi:RloB-like protein|uniref:RloB family protein n=1 Tax=Streptomyces sp. TaxID=1931 RepID=UPI0025F3A71E|nr:RloB family protein [Streptomyces sp.]MBW8799273.1 RloB domain-containing protein [Streptomyces sp.]